jgi:hypothetical protein
MLLQVGVDAVRRDQLTRLMDGAGVDSGPAG